MKEISSIVLTETPTFNPLLDSVNRRQQKILQTNTNLNLKTYSIIINL